MPLASVARRGVVLALVVVALLCVLIWWVRLPLVGLLRQFEVGDVPLLGVVVLLTVANLSLSVVKFNLLVDQPVAFAPALAATSVGALFGQVMPVQLSISAARAFAVRITRGPDMRAAATSMYEQFFDLIVIIAAAVAAIVWGFAGVFLAMLAFFTGLGVLSLTMRGLFEFTARQRFISLVGRSWLRDFASLSAQTRRLLLAASGLRYMLTLIRALLILHIMDFGSILGLAAAAYPLVQIAAAAPLTPGGLGLVEASWTAILTSGGYSLSQAIAAAVAMRLLIVLSQMVLVVTSVVVAAKCRQ